MLWSSFSRLRDYGPLKESNFPIITKLCTKWGRTRTWSSQLLAWSSVPPPEHLQKEDVISELFPGDHGKPSPRFTTGQKNQNAALLQVVGKCRVNGSRETPGGEASGRNTPDCSTPSLSAWGKTLNFLVCGRKKLDHTGPQRLHPWGLWEGWGRPPGGSGLQPPTLGNFNLMCRLLTASYTEPLPHISSEQKTSWLKISLKTTKPRISKVTAFLVLNLCGSQTPHATAAINPPSVFVQRLDPSKQDRRGLPGSQKALRKC